MPGTDLQASSRAVHARLLKALAAGLVLAELLGQSGLVASLVDGGVAGLFHLPFVAPALAAAFAAQVLGRPHRGEIAAALVAGAALFSPLHARAAAEPSAAMVAVLAALGLGSFAVLSARALQAGFSREPGRDAELASLQDVLLPSALLAAFVVLSGPMVQLTAALWPTTYDERVLQVDPAFGAPLSFAVARLTAAVPGLASLCKAVYVALPLALGLVHAARRRAGVHGDLLVAFVALTAVGYLGYHVVPVAGPVYAFPSLFPATPPDWGALAAGRAPVQPMPRNCMPSLHTAWALLVWWDARPLGAAARTAAAAFFAITLLATVGLGFHYGVDLVAAWPLAMAVDAWNAPSSTPGRDRMVAGGTAATILWIAFVAWSPWALPAPGAVVALAGLAVVAASEFVQRRFARVASHATAGEAGGDDAAAAHGDAGDARDWRDRVACAGLALAGAAAAVLLQIVASTVAPLVGVGAMARGAGLALVLGAAAAGLSAARRITLPSGRDRMAAAAAMGLAGTAWIACSALGASLATASSGGFAASPWKTLAIAVAAMVAASITASLAWGGAGRRLDAAGVDGGAIATAFLLGGASAGTLATTVLAIPSLWSAPLAGTLAAASAVLLGVAAFGRRGPTVADGVGTVEAGLPPAQAAVASRGEERISRLRCAAVAAPAAFALAVHARLVESLLGGSVYARGETATVVLAGLAAGAAASSLHRAGGASRLRSSAIAAAAAALVVAALSGRWTDAPAWFASFAYYVEAHGLLRLGSPREALRLFAAVFFLLPLSLGAGAAIALSWRVGLRGEKGGWAGDLPWCCAGAVLGVVAAQATASLAPSVLLAGACAALAATALALAARAKPDRRAIAVASVALVVVLASGGPAPQALSSASPLSLAPDVRTPVEAAFVDGNGVVVVRRDADGAPVFAVDGHARPRPSSAVAAQDLVAGRDVAVVAGLDASGAAASLLRAGFRQVVVAEPREALVAAARTWPGGDALAAPAVDLRFHDARVLLGWEARPVDFLRVAAVDPLEALSGQSSTREFFELAAARLAPGGVLEHHVATRRLGVMGLASLLASARRAFADVRVVAGSEEAVLVGCPVECGAVLPLSIDRAVLATADVDRLLESIASQIGVDATALGAADRDLFLPFQSTAAWAPATSQGMDAGELLSGFAKTLR